MAKSFAHEVVETSSSTGTGTYDLAGTPAGSAYRTFRQEFSNGETKVVYMVRNAGNTKWELNRFGTLTYGTPDTLSRNVIKSTNSDAAVSWVSGDLPLTIYIPANADVHEGAVTGWLAAARNGLLRFGHWFKQDDPSSNKHAWKIYDGASDIQIGIVNTVAHTIEMACMPAGVVLPFAGASAPAGFLLCFGQAVSRTTYAALFAAIGTTYGVGDGSTNFNLPDCRGRVVAGQDDMGGTSANRLTSPIDGDVLGTAGGGQSSTTTIDTFAAGIGVDNSIAGTTAVFPGIFTSAAFSVVQPTIILNYMISTGGV